MVGLLLLHIAAIKVEKSDNALSVYYTLIIFANSDLLIVINCQ